MYFNLSTNFLSLVRKKTEENSDIKFTCRKNIELKIFLFEMFLTQCKHFIRKFLHIKHQFKKRNLKKVMPSPIPEANVGGLAVEAKPSMPIIHNHFLFVISKMASDMKAKVYH